METVVLLTLFALSMILFGVVVYDHITDNSLSKPDKNKTDDSQNDQ